MKTESAINGLKQTNQKWNSRDVRMRTNCYMYALNLTHNPLTGIPLKGTDDIQPGSICNRAKYPDWDNILFFNHSEKGINKFLREVYKDCKHIGYQIRKSSYEEQRRGKWWKIALCLERGDAQHPQDGDYHWYRQNDDGTWSHKKGDCWVKNCDNSYNVILNPELCNRGGYKNFIGYFLVRKKPR